MNDDTRLILKAACDDGEKLVLMRTGGETTRTVVDPNAEHPQGGKHERVHHYTEPTPHVQDDNYEAQRERCKMRVADVFRAIGEDRDITSDEKVAIAALCRAIGDPTPYPPKGKDGILPPTFMQSDDYKRVQRTATHKGGPDTSYGLVWNVGARFRAAVTDAAADMRKLLAPAKKTAAAKG